MPWFFMYGISTGTEQAKKDLGSWERYEKATLMDYNYTFTGSHPDWGNAGTSTLIPVEGGTVLGVAYLISDEQVAKLAADAAPYEIRNNEIKLKATGEVVPALTLQPQQIAELNPPSDEYVALVRKGLSEHYVEELVELYLDRALHRTTLTEDEKVLIQNPTPESFKREYGCDFRRLFPWKATRTTPFGSAWATLNPGDQTTPQCHDEEETFVVISGEALVNTDGHEFIARKGDTVYFEPFATHTVINNSNEPFEMLCIWWGEVPQPQAAAPVEQGA